MTAANDIIAIIPARGGSKRLPGKNLMLVGGQPLLGHTLRHAKESRRISATYVSTDDDEIARLAESYGATVISRPADVSGDDASSESALLHALDWRNQQGQVDPDLVVFLQCTSPIRAVDDIDRAIETFELEGADSLFSGSDSKRHIWAKRNGAYVPLTYDFRNRHREQDMPKQYNEDGSIWIFKPEVLRRENNRLGGHIAVHEMGPWREYQIDTVEDAELIGWILRRPEFAAPIHWPETIELVVFDFDGVMTDNTVMTTGEGIEAVPAHRGDGWGIARLRDAGVPMLVLSTEANPVTAARCAKLGIECIHGVGNKGARLKELLDDRGVDPANTVYVGNDENDLDCLKEVGLPVAVADAHESVLRHVRLVLSRSGGHGAVRELCDLVLVHTQSRHRSNQTRCEKD